MENEVLENVEATENTEVVAEVAEETEVKAEKKAVKTEKSTLKTYLPHDTRHDRPASASPGTNQGFQENSSVSS